MAIDPERADLTVGIIGTGVMGRGIAQVAAEGGMTVLLADARLEAVAEAQRFCAEMIARKAQKGQIPEARAREAVARIRTTPAGPDAGYAAFSECDLAVEAVAENMAVKHAVLERTRGRGAGRLHHRHQHLLAAGDRLCGQGAAARARRGLPFLQPGADDAPRRGGRGSAHRALGARR